MRALPDHFTCATCREVLHLESRCVDASSVIVQRCVWCCGCLAHAQDDPGGRAVFAGMPLRWRGLDGRAGRRRRQR